VDEEREREDSLAWHLVEAWLRGQPGDSKEAK